MNMVSLSVDDIFAKEWQELDFLLEDVEKGRKKESVLIENETFLHMLAAVKSNVSEYMKIPSFIRGSKICQKYCRRYNSTVIQFFADPNASIMDIYKEYLNLSDSLKNDVNLDADNEHQSVLSSSELLLRRKDKMIEYENKDKQNRLNQYIKFCEKMNYVWTTAKVEKQLVRNNEAFIYGETYDLSKKGTSFLEAESNLNKSKRISRSVKPKVHKLQTGHDYYKVILGKVEEDGVLADEFDLEPELFKTFMAEKGYNWELGAVAYCVEPPAYYDCGLLAFLLSLWQMSHDDWIIVNFRYVLKIIMPES